MSLPTIETDKLGVGPCKIDFGTTYLGRTSGDTTGEYTIETDVLETEEDGTVDEVVSGEGYVVSIPLIYTDIVSLSNIIPWAEVTESGEDKKLVVKSAIGKRLSQYADELTVHPLENDDGVLVDDVTVFKCYPKPGPITFTYSRTGQRIANVDFVAMKGTNNKFWGVGDQTIAANPVLSTDEVITDGDIDPIITVEVNNDTYAAESSVEDTANWTYTDTASGLTLNTIQRLSDTEVAISFSGTASAETATLVATATALTGTTASDAMDIEIVV